MGVHFDVCNGDADGLSSAIQWRLHESARSLLLTGLKREITLLERVPAMAGDDVNVFDLSMQRNRNALLHLLDAGVRVRYFDHHLVRQIPSHALLDAHIDSASDTCTSLLVDREVGGAFRAWALVGAYGDNLTEHADQLARESGFDAADRDRLRRIGEALNYNAYGGHERDVRIPPAQLYAILARYSDPRELLKKERIIDEIEALRNADMKLALAWPVHWQSERGSVYVLPDAPWSRRVQGAFANALASAHPQKAHAVLKAQRSCYVVSVRAPQAQPTGAYELCSHFGGSGRARAAGIDALPSADLDRFVAVFAATRWGASS
ncbi:MAG: hypothetical protein V4532_08840 [Pseudomonadota bacterium]